MKAHASFERPAIRRWSLEIRVRRVAALELRLAAPVLNAGPDEQMGLFGQVNDAVGAEPRLPRRLRVLEVGAADGRRVAGLVRLAEEADAAGRSQRVVGGVEAPDLDLRAQLGVIVGRE